MIKFHAFLTKFLRENNINTEQENESETHVLAEKMLESMVQLQNQLKIPNNTQEIKKIIDKITIEISQNTVLTVKSLSLIQQLAISSELISD